MILVSNEHWEKIYLHGGHQSVWPWSELVSLVMRYAVPLFNTSFSVLELGCGAGANIPLFQNLGANYYGIDISPTIIDRLQERFPTLSNNLKAADFSSKMPFDGPFDVLVDRGSLTHNTSASIKSTLELLGRLCHTNSLLFGVNWISTESSDFRLGEPTEDLYCRNNFSTGQFKDLGLVHFASKEHLLDLLTGFEVIELKHTTHDSIIPTLDSRLAYWNFVAKKCQ